MEKEPLEFPSESPQRKKDLINPIGKAREERFDFSALPLSPSLSFVPGQYERCAGERISSRFPIFPSSFLFLSSLP